MVLTDTRDCYTQWTNGQLKDGDFLCSSYRYDVIVLQLHKAPWTTLDVVHVQSFNHTVKCTVTLTVHLHYQSINQSINQSKQTFWRHVASKSAAHYRPGILRSPRVYENFPRISIVTHARHADGSRVSIAITRLWFCLSVCLSVCPRDETRTAETKITWHTIRVVQSIAIPRPPMNIRSKVKVRVIGLGDRVAGVSYAPL